MTARKLTLPAGPAHKAPMDRKQETGGVMKLFVPLVALAALTGCISVDVPDKPIVIELNINITQQVIYQLAQDAQDTIEENADIF